MDEILQFAKDIFSIAPQWAAIVFIAYLWQKSGKRIVGSGNEYVKRSDCHRHIDNLNDELSKSFTGLHNDIREVRGLLIRHIEINGGAK